MFNSMKAKSTQEDVIICLQAILDGKKYVWSDFTDVPIQDQELDAIRLRVLELEKVYPSGNDSSYLSDEGLKIIQSIIVELQPK